MSAPGWLVEKVARLLADRCGEYADPETYDKEAARAVLDLVGPEQLVWTHFENLGEYVAASFHGSYEVEVSSTSFRLWGPPEFGGDLGHFPTLEAAQAAAQAHADEAWWAQTKAAKERDNG